MTQDEALQAINDMLVTVQKARSNIREFFDYMGYVDYMGYDDEVGEHMMQDMHPWLFGTKGDGLVVALADLASGAKPLDGMDLYNMMIVAHKLEPTIALTAGLRHMELPEPDLASMLRLTA